MITIDENKLLIILLEQSLNHKEKQDSLTEILKFLKVEMDKACVADLMINKCTYNPDEEIAKEKKAQEDLFIGKQYRPEYLIRPVVDALEKSMDNILPKGI